MMTRVRMEGKAVWRVNWGVWEVARGLGRGGRSHGLLGGVCFKGAGSGRRKEKKNGLGALGGHMHTPRPMRCEQKQPPLESSCRRKYRLNPVRFLVKKKKEHTSRI